MKLFEKIRRFIRGADKAITDVICEHLDNTARGSRSYSADTMASGSEDKSRSAT